MKKISLVSIISIVFLSLSSLFAYLLRAINTENPIIMLVVGVVILIVSAILAFIGKRRFDKSIAVSIICMLISSVALGFCIRSWYIFREFDNSLLTMLAVSCCCAVYLWVFYSLSQIPLFQNPRVFPVFFIIFIILSLAAYILVISFTKTTFVSTFGYYMIIEIAFAYALCIGKHDIKATFFECTVATYSIFVVAIIMAMIMLEADADFLECGDLLPDSAPSKQQMQKKKQTKNRL